MHCDINLTTSTSSRSMSDNVKRTKLEYALVIDIQNDKIQIGLVCEDSIIVDQIRIIKKDDNTSASFLLDYIERIGKILLSRHSDILPIGIGICAGGSVDIQKQTMVFQNETDYPIAEKLSKIFHLPAYLLSNCKSGIIGEYLFGDARKYHTSVYLHFTDEGIGAGVMHDSMLLIGENGNAGGAGHTLVDTRFNLKCMCGGVGHWKAYATSSGIENFYEEFFNYRRKNNQSLPTSQGTQMEPNLRSWQILDLLKSHPKSDEPNEGSFNEFSMEFGKIFARGILNIVAMYNPGLIILDGPIMRSHFETMHRLIVDSMESSLFKRTIPEYPEIRPSKLEGYAHFMGMVAYVIKLYRDRISDVDVNDVGIVNQMWYFPKK